MSLFKYIEKVFKLQKNSKFEFIYILVDIHNTVLVSCFDKAETYIYYPYAEETLKLLSDNEHVKLIMWTSTYPNNIDMYLNHFKSKGINFDFVNENPEINNNSFACFDSKFFYDIGIDDKFGFNPNEDWYIIFKLLNEKL